MTYTITRDEIAGLDALSDTLAAVEIHSTPTGYTLSTTTEDGDDARIGTWNGIIIVTVLPSDAWGTYEHEYDGFSTLADAVRFAQGHSWGDYAP